MGDFFLLTRFLTMLPTKPPCPIMWHHHKYKSTVIVNTDIIITMNLCKDYGLVQYNFTLRSSGLRALHIKLYYSFIVSNVPYKIQTLVLYRIRKYKL